MSASFIILFKFLSVFAFFFLYWIEIIPIAKFFLKPIFSSKDRSDEKFELIYKTNTIEYKSWSKFNFHNILTLLLLLGLGFDVFFFQEYLTFISLTLYYSYIIFIAIDIVLILGYLIGQMIISRKISEINND